MKSMQTKGRNKKKNEKFFVKSTSSTVRPDRPDLSNLRKPIDTSVSDLHQVSRLLEDGTDEVKAILSYECNIIYECRTCRSLFRSIVNLVSHKREYCREKFDITLHRPVFHNYNLSAKESMIHMYKTEQTSNEAVKNDRILRSQVPKEPNKKDLSTIIDMLNKRREESTERQLENESAISDASNCQHIHLQSIDTNCSAVYQTVKSSNVVDTMDLMKEQITELQNMADQNALTTPECSSEGQKPVNQLEKSDSLIMDMSDEENELLIHRLQTNNLSCTICNAKFSTKKTLTVHMKTLHASQRMCYPCPYCTSTFANTWSVYRHLYKAHKKTNEQVRKLRTQIQETAYERKTTAMKDTENVRARKASALKNMMENNDKIQKPISHTESNIKIRRCSRRDRQRRLNKKASFKKTYLQYCQTPIAACDETTIRIKRPNKLSTSTSDNILCEAEDITLETNTSKKIEPSDDKNISDKDSENILSSSDVCDQNTFIRVEAVSSKEDWNMIENQHNSESNLVDNNNDPDITSPVTENIDNSESLSRHENGDNLVPNKNVISPDIIWIDTNEVSSAVLKMRTKKEKASSHDSKKQSTDLKERDMIEAENDNSKSQSSCSIQPNGKNWTLLMESKIATIADFRKLQCLLCRRKFTSVPNLRRHMAIHIGWNRYRCKLCDFKCFVKCDCVAHCNKVHNTQNNRAAIAEIVAEISQDEYMCNEIVITDVTSARKETDSPDVTETIASSCISETRADANSSNDLNTTLLETTGANEQVAESHGNAGDQSVDAEDGDKADGKTRDLSECMINCGSGKLDADPELKRMVMEVIFGSTDVSATKQTDSDKLALEAGNGASGCADTNDNVNNITDESKKTSCPILVKHQRPTRNRIKPLSDDFIYDLKEVAYRKESALFNSETLHVRKKAKLYN